MANFKMTRYEKMIFFRQLSMIYDSEIAVFEGVELIKNRSKTKKQQEFYENLKLSVLQGNSLSDSLSKSNIGIEPHEIKIIEIGEKTGRISTVLTDIADSIERSLEVGTKLKSAFRYPLILGGITFAVIIVLLVVIVPVFHNMLVLSGVELGGLSEILYSISLFLRSYGVLLGAFLIAFVLCLYFYFKNTESGRILADKLSHKSIFTRDIKKNASAVGFAKNLAMLIDSGISFSESMEILQETVTGKIEKEKILKAGNMLKEGGNISEAFETLSMFPDVLLQIVGVASESGHLVSSLKKAENIMRNDLDESVEKLSARVEPTLTVILSLIVGMVLLSSIIPIFSVLNSMG